MSVTTIPDERHIADAIHDVVGSLAPDDRLMILYMVVAEIISANYREEAHDLLAAMAQHDVLDFLIAISLAEQRLLQSHREAA